MRRPLGLILAILVVAALGLASRSWPPAPETRPLAERAALADEAPRPPRGSDPALASPAPAPGSPSTTTPTSAAPRPPAPGTTAPTTPATSPAPAPTTPVTSPSTTLPPAPPTTQAPPTTEAPLGQFTIARTNADGTAVRWNPCQAVRVVINLQGAPSFARAELAAALAALESASGIDLVDAGTSTERPLPNRPLQDSARYGAGYAPLLVSFASAVELPFGSPGASGWGQAVPLVNPATGRLQYVTGQVVLRPDHGWTQGTSSANPLSLMLRHELGHVLGLGHVSATTEIMTTAGNGSARTWGPGDLRGLAAVGRPAGCLPPMA